MRPKAYRNVVTARNLLLGLTFGFLLSHSWAVSEQPWKRMESEETTRSKMK
jgi:hypothetical protein